MIRRGVCKIVWSQSLSIFSSQNNTNSNRYFPPKPLHFHSFMSNSRNIGTSPQDNLDGLNDPEAQDKPAQQSTSMEDFKFLNTNADSNVAQSGKCSEDAVFISNAINTDADDFTDERQKLLRKFRGKLNESLVIEVLKLVKNPQISVRFFIWAGRQIGYSHTERVYNALIKTIVFDDNNNCKLPDQFLNEIRDDDREVLGKLFNVFIQKCCRNGLWNVALEELGRLKDFGYRPSKVTYNALVLVFLKADRLDTAFLVHREMSDSGVSMDRFTLGCFAEYLCRVGMWREALKIIEEEEFMPDTDIYNKMINGLCEASLFEEAMEFLHRMRCSSCLPNVVTYRILLTGCLRKKELGRCKRILNMMIAEGCYPRPSLFHSLLHAYCSSGDYAYGFKLLQKMAGCGCKPGYVAYNIFIGGVCGNKDFPSLHVFELAERAYSDMLDSGILLNKVNVGNFVRCLCGVGKFDKAFTVIREMMNKGFVPDTDTYTNAIGFLCQASKLERASLLFQEMKGKCLTPDVYTYTILVDSFCKVGLIQQARNLFDEMIRDGCKPNVVTYTALIHAFLKARRVSDANELFEKMIADGCTPNIVTFTALIDGHCKAGDVQKASHIYSRMRGDECMPDVDMYFRGVGSTPSEPNVVTYGALVDGLCKVHKVAEARDLLDSMSMAGCYPNHIVYDALIDGFCKVGKLDEAQDVFAKMTECGYSPNVYTYSSLIDRLFKDKRLDLALKILSKMLENSCPPNVVTYTEMIDGLCKVGKTDEAYKLLVMMEEKGCHPNVVTYTAMIDGFGKVGNVDMSLKLLEQMCAKGCAPNFVTYRVLINHCCAKGLLDEAHKLLEEMKQTYWPRHVAGYRKVIEGFSKDFIVSLGLINEISDDSSLPIVPAYYILINSYNKAGRLEMALELHKEILTDLGISAINKDIYYSLIESLTFACKVEKAFELFGDMSKQGFIPELHVFFFLIRGLIKVNRWDVALQLSHSLCHMDIYWQSMETSDRCW